MSMDKHDFLTRAGLQVQTLEFWIEQRWLIPEEMPAGPAFTDGDVARSRLIRDLKIEFGINDEGIDVILHLVDQLHGVRQALAQLQEELRER